MTCSSLAMTHPRAKKRCFFFFTIIGEFLYDVPLQISENFKFQVTKILEFQLSGRTYVRVTCSSLFARPHCSSLFIRCSFQLICQIVDSAPSTLELMSTVWQGIGIDSNVCSLSRHNRTFVRNICSLSRWKVIQQYEFIDLLIYQFIDFWLFRFSVVKCPGARFSTLKC